MLTSKDIAQRKVEIEQLANKYGIQSVRIYGSVARGCADEDSDVDLLVEAKDGTSLLSLGGFQVEMERLLGRKVDVSTLGGLKKRIRDRAMKEAVAL